MRSVLIKIICWREITKVSQMGQIFFRALRVIIWLGLPLSLYSHFFHACTNGVSLTFLLRREMLPDVMLSATDVGPGHGSRKRSDCLVKLCAGPILFSHISIIYVISSHKFPWIGQSNIPILFSVCGYSRLNLTGC